MVREDDEEEEEEEEEEDFMAGEAGTRKRPALRTRYLRACDAASETPGREEGTEGRRGRSARGDHLMSERKGVVEEEEDEDEEDEEERLLPKERLFFQSLSAESYASKLCNLPYSLRLRNGTITSWSTDPWRRLVYCERRLLISFRLLSREVANAATLRASMRASSS